MPADMLEAQTDSSAKRAKEVVSRWDKLKGVRGIWESHWQDVADFVMPGRTGFNTTIVKGEKRHQLIYDGTAPWALGELAAALHGMLTSPFNKWFLLATSDPKLMQERDVRIYLEKCEESLFAGFNSAEADFNSQAHELYQDLAGLGTGVMDMEETPGVDPGFRFWTRSLGECCIAENAAGRIDTLYRKFPMSARAAYQQWGDAVGPKLYKLMMEEPDRDVMIIHEVRPRVDRDMDRWDVTNKPFSSIYVSAEDNWLISESGFDEFPHLVPRWTKAAGETYGRSPAMTCLPDIKMLNKMWETIIKAGQKVLDPPLMVPDDGFFLPIRTTPAGINFYRTGMSKDDRIIPLETRGNIPVGLDMADRRMEHVLRCFYQDRLKLQKEKIEMTRYEAQERAQENLRAMSPIVGRLQIEFMNPLVERAFRIQEKQGRLPQPPDILLERGASLNIVYVSPMARAQRISEADSLQSAMALLAPLIQASPEMMDNFDGDAIARSTKDWFGFPEKLMNSQSKVRQARQARAEMMAREQERADAETAGKVAPQLAGR